MSLLLSYKLSPLKPTIPTLNMLSMAFKLVENNLSPTQRSRSQVKEKQGFFKRLECSLLIYVGGGRTSTLSSNNSIFNAISTNNVDVTAYEVVAIFSHSMWSQLQAYEWTQNAASGTSSFSRNISGSRRSPRSWMRAWIFSYIFSTNNLQLSFFKELAGSRLIIASISISHNIKRIIFSP